MKKSNRSKSLIALAGFGAAAVAAGWFGSRYSPKDARTRLWYSRLDKPSYDPPEFVFPLVWTSLYALMAISGWRVWKTGDCDERSRALCLWAGQLTSNAEWTKLFFDRHRPKLALADIVVLETMIVKYILAAEKVDRPAALCFAPHAAWVAFAAVLNFEIARRNPDAHKKFPRPRVA